MPELLSAEEVAAGLADLDGWTGDTSAISRTATLSAFLTAIGVVDRVAAAAEAMDHHPDIDIRWRTLTFSCTTHSKRGVTDNDFSLARRIDEIIAAAGGQ